MLKSLRDLLLEQSVRNFGKIFLESHQAGPGTFNYMVKKGIYLLPHLFEDILLKSDQTGWPIPYKFIKPCLSNRDVLLWTNVDIKTGILDADDLLDLSKSKLPLKQLYFVTDLMTNSMMEVLGKWSEDLEFLQILYRNKARARWHEGQAAKALKFPKLKRLVLNIDIFIPDYFHLFGICQSPHLQELVIFSSANYNFHYRRERNLIENRFVNLIKNGNLSEKLKRLAILIPINYEITRISNYRHLRVLELPDQIWFAKMSNLKNIIARSNSHKHLELTCHDPEQSEGRLILKYDLEDLLLLIETRSESFYYEQFNAGVLLKNLLELVLKDAHQVSPQQWRRVEKVILEFIKRHHYEDVQLIYLFKDKVHHLSKDFMMKISDFFVNTPIYSNKTFDVANCQELKNFMYSYVTSEPNKTRSLKYLSHLIFCDSVCKDPSFKSVKTSFNCVYHWWI